MGLYEIQIFDSWSEKLYPTVRRRPFTARRRAGKRVPPARRVADV